MAIKAVELTISGEVQGVGYREFVARIARKLKLVGFVENQKDGTVKVRCKGEEATLGKFKELITVKTPSEAPLINVETVAERLLKEADITETAFEERYGDSNIELLQAVSTGTRYIGHLSNKIDQLGVNLGNKIDNLSAETKSGFNKTNERLDAGFGKMDNKLDQFRVESNSNFQELGVKYGKISTTLERIDKNIEKIATKKKGIFD